MRLRNVKNKKEIMDSSNYLVLDYSKYKGNWNNYFGNNKPIDLEIGMGKGKFLYEMALRNPDVNYIGIEKFDSVIAMAIKKIPEGINNLVIVRMNADYIEDAFDKEIRNIYLNFSDPWPKKRWAKRRLTSDVFLNHYDKVFKETCNIIQKTDNKELFAYSIESLSTYGYKLHDVSLDLHNDPNIIDNIETEFEEKFSKTGPIYRLIATKE